MPITTTISPRPGDIIPFTATETILPNRPAIGTFWQRPGRAEWGPR